MKIFWNPANSQLKIVTANNQEKIIVVTEKNYRKTLQYLKIQAKTDAVIVSKNSESINSIKQTFNNAFNCGLEEMELPSESSDASGVLKEAESFKFPKGCPELARVHQEKDSKPKTFNNKLVAIAVREQLIDEIDRLKKERIDTAFMKSSEPKIQILSQILQLITAPNALQKKIYFKERNQVNLTDIIQQVLLENSTVKFNGKYITNFDVLNTPRNPNDRDNHPTKNRIRTTSLKFLENLVNENPTIVIEKDRTILESKIFGKKPITSVVIMGDSLSDQGQMVESKLGKWSGIDKFNSAQGSFSNGFIWSDNFFNKFAIDTLIKYLKEKKHLDDEDIADLISEKKGTSFDRKFRKIFNFKNDREFWIENRLLARIYAIGGLTSHSYFGQLSEKIALTFARMFVSTLEEQRSKLFEDDKHASRRQAEKNTTVVIEWSGANDLITVNEKPTYQEADDSITARVENAEALIKNGYKNIILFNLPDLSQTPRYRRLSLEEQENAHKVSIYYNNTLEIERAELQEMHPDCKVQVFDVYKYFNEIVNHPLQYHFNTVYKNQKVDNFLSNSSLEENTIYYQSEGGECGIMRCSKLPSLEALKKTDKSQYILTPTGFHYFNQSKNLLQSITTEQDKLARLKKHFPNMKEVELLGWDLSKINEITGHLHNKYDKKIVYKVIDPCGQLRTERFNLTTRLDKASTEKVEDLIDRKIQEHALEKGHILVSDTYLEANPDCGYASPRTPFKETQAFKRFEEEAVAKDLPLHALGSLNLMFYDNVHPTSDMHIAIFNIFMKKFFNKNYAFIPPEIDLESKLAQLAEAPEQFSWEKDLGLKAPLEGMTASISERREQLTCAFVERYLKKWRTDRLGFFGFTKIMGFSDYKNASLESILEHAKTGKRSQNILIEAGWISKDGTINKNIVQLLEKDYLEEGKNNIYAL